jgi:hypothetical protein
MKAESTTRCLCLLHGRSGRSPPISNPWSALFAKKVNVQRESRHERIRQAVFALLHSPPSSYGLNRTSWKMTDLQGILRGQGRSLSLDLIRTIIRKGGFKWRKARVVSTSRDPNYLAKVETIVKILSELKGDEAFFSIDEFGPFAVKKRGCSRRKRAASQQSQTGSGIELLMLCDTRITLRVGSSRLVPNI